MQGVELRRAPLPKAITVAPASYETVDATQTPDVKTRQGVHVIKLPSPKDMRTKIINLTGLPLQFLYSFHNLRKMKK
jgi:hypothetical protein